MVDRYPGVPETPNAQLVERIRKMEQDFRDVRSNLLRAAGLQAEPDLLRVLGSLVVEGDLSVPNGSIDNDALSSPVGFTAGADGLDATVPPASFTKACEFTLTLPDWAGVAQVTAIGTANVAGGSGAGTFYLTAGGVTSDAKTINVGPGESNERIIVLTTTLADPGTSVDVALWWRTASGTLIGGSARLDAQALWTRSAS